MLGRMYDGQICSAARALESVGERWTLLILRDVLLRGMSHFGEYRASLGIATNVLAARLESLVADGLLTREESGRPGQFAYLPTEKARDVLPVIVALTAWGDRWAAPGGPPVTLVHDDCRGPVVPRMTCATCGADVAPEAVGAVPGPGFTPPGR